MPQKRLCVDTSGLTQPFRTYRQSIFPRLWRDVFEILASGEAAMTQEIFDEITAGRGDALTNHVGMCRRQLVLDVGDQQMSGYINVNSAMIGRHRSFVAEYCNRDDTVGINDISIIAQAKHLGLPLLSMETSRANSQKRRGIPDICATDGVRHLEFQDFLELFNLRY